MRILHALDHSLPLQSGYVYRSLGILSAQRSFGWETVQVTGASQNAYRGAWDEMDGWRFHRTRRVPKALHIPGVRGGAEMWALRQRLIQVMREAGPDLMHAHSPVQVGWPALLAARRAGVPFVYEILWAVGGCGGRSWPRSGRGRAAPHDGTHGNRVDGTSRRGGDAVRGYARTPDYARDSG